MTKNYLTQHLSFEDDDEVPTQPWNRTSDAADDVGMDLHTRRSIPRNDNFRVQRPPSVFASPQRGGLTREEQTNLLPPIQEDEDNESSNKQTYEDNESSDDDDRSRESDVIVVKKKKTTISTQPTPTQAGFRGPNPPPLCLRH